jgi:hypothetical protein
VDECTWVLMLIGCGDLEKAKYPSQEHSLHPTLCGVRADEDHVVAALVVASPRTHGPDSFAPHTPSA